MEFPQKIKLPYDPTSRYISKRIKNRILKGYLYTHIHAALSITDKMWKQPKSALMDECIKKMWYINTIECYSA